MRPFLLLLLALAGCARAADAPQDLPGLEAELATAVGPAETRDAAMRAALAAPIMVDPGLSQSANAHNIRPPEQPETAAIPVEVGAGAIDPVPAGTFPPAPAPAGSCPDCSARSGAFTLAALAQRQRDAATAACARTLGYSATWGLALPAAAPLYPGALVIEGAGSDRDGCALRLVAFTTPAPPSKLAAFYHARAVAAGFTVLPQADGDTRVLGAKKGAASFTLYAVPRGAGSRVELIVNGG